MSNGDDNTLEDEIRNEFLDNIGENLEISEGVVEVIRELSDEEDFGGREQLAERVLEVKEADED